MNYTRVIVWTLLALIVGVASGYYFGYNSAYDAAVNVFVAAK